MSSTQHDAQTAHSLAGLLILGAAIFLPASVASATDLQDLANRPEKYLGQEVEIVGVCVKHGRKGDVLGYECETDKGVYVDARDVEPEAAKKKLDAGCDGNDCSVTIRFTPHSYSTSSMVEPGKDITIFNAAKATVSSGD